MKRLTVEIVSRDFIEPLILPRLEWQVKRYSHAALGGPYEADIAVMGSDEALWQLTEMLRCPIIIRDEKGQAVWNGYINEIEIIAAGQFGNSPAPVAFSVGLTQMFNRIAVAYTRINIDGVMERATTDFADDLFSQGIYGIKENVATANNLSDAAAEQARDTLLAQKRLPVPEITFRESLPSRAVIRCLGWSQSLSWKYAKVLTTGNVDTAVQAQYYLDTYGQFIRVVQNEIGTSGVLSTEYREGDRSALYELEKLCQVGTTNDRRMLWRMTRDRRAELYEESSSETLYFQRSDGSILDPYGVSIRNEAVEAGYWVQIIDVVPPSVNATSISSPELRFIEEVEYIVDSDELRFKYRDALDPFRALEQLIERNSQSSGGIGEGELEFSGHQHTYSEDWTPLVDGSRTLFISINEFETETTEVLVNGVAQRLSVDYTEGASLDEINLTAAPVAGDELIFNYIMAFEVPE